MSKKLIITLSVIFCVIVVILILFWTLFGLSTVTVEYSSTTQNLTVSDEEIVEAGQFRMGACVLFEGKQKSIDSINEYVSENPNFAYLRVINIETVFPNKFVVHVTEREELFAVEVSGKYLVCDREFRVLRIETEYVSVQGEAILLKGLEFSNEDVAVGDFLDIEQEGMKSFYSVMLQNNRDLSEILGKFKELTLGTYEDEITGKEYISLEITTYQNKQFVIYNINFAFANKVQLMFAIESSLYNQSVDENGNILNSNGEITFVTPTETGELIPYEESDDENGDSDTNIEKYKLSYDLLSRCMIKIDNLTLDANIERTETDIYYSFVLTS